MAKLFEITDENFSKDEIFGLMIPDNIDGVDSAILNPINAWTNKDLFDVESRKLSDLFKENFHKYGEQVDHLKAGGPV